MNSKKDNRVEILLILFYLGLSIIIGFILS